MSTKNQVWDILSQGYDVKLNNKQLAMTLTDKIDAPLTTIQRSISDFKRNFRKPVHNVLVIPDIHLPFEHKDALNFVKQVRDEYGTSEVVFLGDILDMNSGVSFHPTDPDGLSQGEEFSLAEGKLGDWYSTFPNAKVCIGNHDRRPNRKAFNAGISSRWVRTINEVYDLPNWDFKDTHQLGDFLFYHGEGQNALAKSKDMGLSVIGGHRHSIFEMKTWFDRPDNLVRYAGHAGCLVDGDSYAMAYGKHFKPSIMGCAVIEDIYGVNPVVKLIPMYNEEK